MANDSVSKALKHCNKIPQKENNSTARARKYGRFYAPVIWAPTRRYRAPAKALTKVRSIVILVHGIRTDLKKDDVYEPFINKAFRTLWQSELAETGIIKLNWGTDGLFEASDNVGGRAHTASGMTDRAWVGVTKLKQVVAQTRNLFGFAVPITIVSYSQGTVITLAALQEGLKVEHWILMGSPLDAEESIAQGENNTNMGAAARNVSGVVLNLYSGGDWVAGLKGGIGTFGLPRNDDSTLDIYGYRSNNIVEVGITGVSHTELIETITLDSIEVSSWWEGEWLEHTDAHEWKAFSPQLALFLLRGQRNTTRLDSSGYVRKVDQYTMKRFRELQNFAVNYKEGRWYGDSDENRVSVDFSLTKGMMTGIHFDDKDQAEFNLRCSAGRVKVRLREAVWSTFDKGTKSVTVSAGNSYGTTYKVEGPFDATLFVEITGAGWEKTVSKCHLDFTAADL